MSDQSRTTAVAVARCKSQMEDSREFDDEEALFRVGDVRALLDAIESMCAEIDGAAHNRFYDQRDAYFESVKDERNAN